MAGRNFVTPDDVKSVALAVLRHRIAPSPGARDRGPRRRLRPHRDARGSGSAAPVKSPVPSRAALWSPRASWPSARVAALLAGSPAGVAGRLRRLRPRAARRSPRRARLPLAPGARALRAALARPRPLARVHRAPRTTAAAFDARCEVYDHHPAARRDRGTAASRSPCPARRLRAGALPPAADGARRPACSSPREARVSSPFGLVAGARRASGSAQVLRSYPDFAQAGRLRAPRHRQPPVADRRAAPAPARRRAWNSTSCASTARATRCARSTGRRPRARGRLIAREYEDERDQQIVFLIDCGRRMRRATRRSRTSTTC